MKYHILTDLSVPLNLNVPNEWQDIYLVSVLANKKFHVYKVSKYNYDIIAEVVISCNMLSFLDIFFYFRDSNDSKIKRLAVNDFTILEIEGSLFPKFNWINFKGFFNIETQKYEIFDKNGQSVFESNFYPPPMKFANFGILTFIMNSKENSWISCLDPNGGKEMWRLDFDWNITQLEIHKNLIVIAYHAYERFRTDEGYEGQRNWYNPYKYTIVIDGSSGKEIWRFDEQYEYIDFNNEVVLLKKKHEVIDGKIRSMSVIELDIHTGKELTNVLLSPIKPFGVIPSFVDNEFIYYKVYKGPFGKISKKTGKIVWEFDLIDPYGDKRMVNDWILLGNGKLVLQAPSNQNGTFTCIFDPEENMEFANIIDGVPKD
ncbi:MAG TPA: hypothetical protein PKD16_13625 [Saprospiraceae bacterium]|jgi:outer membrane protein assembly factor BamB|nr:hypothetical protein [Saprospiraceae bacterium]